MWVRAVPVVGSQPSRERETTAQAGQTVRVEQRSSKHDGNANVHELFADLGAALSILGKAVLCDVEVGHERFSCAQLRLSII